MADSTATAAPHSEFDTLVMSLATSAMLNLGAIPDPDTHTSSVNLPLARHSIDMLQMLREKTRGNLTPSEDLLLGRMLADAQFRYTAARK